MVYLDTDPEVLSLVRYSCTKPSVQSTKASVLSAKPCMLPTKLSALSDKPGML